MALDQIRTMNPLDPMNFLYFQLPQLRTQKENKIIFNGMKSIGIWTFGSLLLSTFANVKSTKYIIHTPFYVRYPLRAALFVAPLVGVYYFSLQPAIDSLMKVHMGMSKRVMRYSI